MTREEIQSIRVSYDETKIGRKKVFICTYQNCTCWFRSKRDLREHQKREHEK